MIGRLGVYRFMVLVSPDELREAVTICCVKTGLLLKGAQKNIHLLADTSELSRQDCWEFSLSFSKEPRSGEDESLAGSILFSNACCKEGYLNVLRASQQLTKSTREDMHDGEYFKFFKKLIYKQASKDHFLRLVRLDQSKVRGVKVTRGAVDLTENGWQVADWLHPNSKPQVDYVVEKLDIEKL